MQEMQETQVQSLDWEDTLEEDMATHFIILAWRIWWTEEPSRLQSIGLQRVGHDWSDLACMYGRKDRIDTGKKKKKGVAYDHSSYSPCVEPNGNLDRSGAISVEDKKNLEDNTGSLMIDL